jgi:NAD(P)-dependent dehydrogenase (short-subunit alcohol dehydrogenase family)
MTIHVSSRQFSWDDQHLFARLSGDVNPMHMDPVAARRTSAGGPVVHGVHLLIWAINELAARVTEGLITRVKADWSSFVHIGETADLLVETETVGRLRARICVQSQPVATLSIWLGVRSPVATQTAGVFTPVSTDVPDDLDIAALSQKCGVVDFSSSTGDVQCHFPCAASVLGCRRTAGLLALSKLVGMVCPGLHSIFTGLDVRLVEPDDGDFIYHQVTSLDERYRYITQDIRGAGLYGSVEALVRNPPTRQPGIDELAPSVASGEFAGTTALVIGGSRGLGELTAKLLAAGGARVIISYSVGRADAEKLASSIHAAGGICHVTHYDVRDCSADQLTDLEYAPTHVYYFATGPISQSRIKPFDRQRFEEFFGFYVDGFAHLCSCLKATSERPVGVFYPSSVYVSTEDRPAGLAEYAMAKAAGEVLCGEINSSHRHIHVVSRRLPRMLTDQTASLLSDQPIAPSHEVMLALIRELHSTPKAIEPPTPSE